MHYLITIYIVYEKPSVYICTCFNRYSGLHQATGRYEKIRDAHYSIIEKFAEKESGKRKERPESKKLMNFCKEKKDTLKYVIVSELSRIGRTGRVIETIETLDDLKIGFHCLERKLENPE